MFLANENFPRPSTNILRQNGYAVRSIQEEYPGISDEEVMGIALEFDLIILTFDSDYGELIFKYAKETPPSVIYFRDKKNVPEFAGNILIDIMNKSNIALEKAFTVIEANSIRQRFYKK